MPSPPSHTHTHYSNISADQMLYSEKDLEKSMDKIETVNFHQVCLRPLAISIGKIMEVGRGE